MPPEGVVISDTITTWKEGLVKPQGTVANGSHSAPTAQWRNVHVHVDAHYISGKHNMYITGSCVLRRHRPQQDLLPQCEWPDQCAYSSCVGTTCWPNHILYHLSCPYNRMSTLCILHDRGSVCPIHQPLVQSTIYSPIHHTQSSCVVLLKDI